MEDTTDDLINKKEITGDKLNIQLNESKENGFESNENSLFDNTENYSIISNLDEKIGNETINESTNDKIKEEDSANEESSATISDEDLTTDESGLELTNSIDVKEEPLPDTVTVLNSAFGGKVYLIGTAHFSHKSQDEVAQTIKKVQPNVVVLELCESRTGILSMDEKMILEESKNMNFDKLRNNIKENGVLQGIMSTLFLFLSAKVTQQLGMAPGGEFRRAYMEAKKIKGCIVHLGDRPVNITLSRAISSLSLWQKIHLAFAIIFGQDKVSKEDVEKFKQRDLLEEMLTEMTGEYPALSRVFVDERDKFLAYSLYLAASPIPDLSQPNNYRPAVVVGVVGIGHVTGITKNWGKVSDEDIPPLLTIPEKSKTAVIAMKFVRYSVLGLIGYGCYRLLPNQIKTGLIELPANLIAYTKNKLM